MLPVFVYTYIKSEWNLNFKYKFFQNKKANKIKEKEAVEKKNLAKMKSEKNIRMRKMLIQRMGENDEKM